MDKRPQRVAVDTASNEQTRLGDFAQSATERVVLVGAGGFAREVLQFLEDIDSAGRLIRCDAFIVESGFAREPTIQGVPVLEGFESLRHQRAPVAVAIGAPDIRHRIVETIEREYIGATSVDALVHPTAVVGKRVSFGVGTIVAPLSTATTDIAVGRHVQLHVGAAVGHDVVVGDFVTLSPRSVISGHVEIGEGALVGAGAIILPNLRVGAWATVGAGAVVTKNVADYSTVVGNPARVLTVERAP